MLYATCSFIGFFLCYIIGHKIREHFAIIIKKKYRLSNLLFNILQLQYKMAENWHTSIGLFFVLKHLFFHGKIGSKYLMCLCN